MNHGNITTADIYDRAFADPTYQRDNFCFRIIRRLVVDKRCTRRHGMALWNLYQLKAYTTEQLFHEAHTVLAAYPALSESESCAAMDERGYTWVDEHFQEGEYTGQGYGDRWEPKNWREE